MKPAPTTTIDLGPHRQAVVERAEGVYPGQALAAGQAPGRGPGGDDQAVEAEPLAIGEDHLAGLEVQALGQSAQPPLDVQRVDAAVDADGQRQAIDLPVACEHLLGERRAVVGRVHLVADDCDAAAEALGAQLLRRPHPGQRRPDHDDGLRPGGHPRRSGVDDRDRRLGAAADGLLDLGTEPVGRHLVEHIEEVVVADLEDLGRHLHAARVALTQVEIDHHAVPHRHPSYR
jgi:hypothetical protein